MSEYKPKVGDRVKVVLEGEVTCASNGSVTIEDRWLRGADPDFWCTTVIANDAKFLKSIEKVAPPVVTFKPGDVVRSKSGFGSLVVALDRDGYTYLSGSLADGKRFAYDMGYAPGEFTSEKYELVSL